MSTDAASPDAADSSGANAVPVGAPAADAPLPAADASITTAPAEEEKTASDAPLPKRSTRKRIAKVVDNGSSSEDVS
jgi:hypothetical protein